MEDGSSLRKPAAVASKATAAAGWLRTHGLWSGWLLCQLSEQCVLARHLVSTPPLQKPSEE
jgi:hypothetical protein